MNIPIFFVLYRHPQDKASHFYGAYHELEDAEQGVAQMLEGFPETVEREDFYILKMDCQEMR